MTLMRTQNHGPFVVAHLSGELDIQGYERIAGDLHRLILARPQGLVLDLSQLRYIASIGISLFIQLAQETRTRGGELRLAAPQPRIQILLNHVSLGNLIKIDKTPTDALAQMEKSRVAALIY